MRIVDVARTLLLLICGFAAGASLGAGPFKEIKQEISCQN
jgi:hypothetical protein